MPANPFELRADVRPLEAAATRWDEIAAVMTRRGDEIVTAARRATEGWDAAAAESYDHHRRQVLAHLDRFTALASEIAGSLRAIGSIVTASQKELDDAWTRVQTVPHDKVGDSGYLVFHPSEDGDQGKVDSSRQQSDEIRSRLALALDQESTRLRSARTEFTVVRTELMTLAGGYFPGGMAPGEEPTGVGLVPPPSTSVAGASQAGVAAGLAAGSLPPLAPLSVSMPDLSGISPLGSIAAAAASGVIGRGGAGRSNATTPGVGGMGGAGAMGARTGSMGRSMSSGRSGRSGSAGARLSAPRLEGQAEDPATRAARDKEAAKVAAQQAEKDAKQKALEEKRAERAARRAEREAEKKRRRFDGVPMEGVVLGGEVDDADEADDATEAVPDAETGSERGDQRR